MNIIANISSFSPLNTNANITLKYYSKQALNKKLKLIRGSMNFLQKSYWVRKYLALWFPGLRNIFWKISKTLWSPSYILNVHYLIIVLNYSKFLGTKHLQMKTVTNLVLEISKPFITFKRWKQLQILCYL